MTYSRLWRPGHLLWGKPRQKGDFRPSEYPKGTHLYPGRAYTRSPVPSPSAHRGQEGGLLPLGHKWGCPSLSSRGSQPAREASTKPVKLQRAAREAGRTDQTCHLDLPEVLGREEGSLPRPRGGLRVAYPELALGAV